MNKTRHWVTCKTGFVLVRGALRGADGMRRLRGRTAPCASVAPPPPVYAESRVVVEPEYVYYPGYQVYYSGNTRQYVYLEGRSWVSRPAPPRVSADVLFASPSVRLDFRDSPSIHHATVVRQYPKHWASPESGHDNKEGHGAGNKQGHD